MIRTQDYAKRAYPLVDNMQGDPQEEKYRTLALNFPTMILQSGLVQAIGFLMAKNKSFRKKCEFYFFFICTKSVLSLNGHR